MTDLQEGDTVELDALPESDMTHSGKLESLGDGTLAAQYGDECVTFEWHTVKVTDVTHIDEL